MERRCGGEGREPAECSHRDPKGVASRCSTEMTRGVRVSEDWGGLGDFTLNPGHRGVGWGLGNGSEVRRRRLWVATTLCGKPSPAAARPRVPASACSQLACQSSSLNHIPLLTVAHFTVCFITQIGNDSFLSPPLWKLKFSPQPPELSPF